MSQVVFLALVGRHIHPVSCPLDHSIIDLFEGLRNNPDAAQDIKAPHTVCNFYRLQKPASIAKNNSAKWDDILPRALQECSDDSNRIHVDPVTTKVCELSDMFLRDSVYLVIVFPAPQLESVDATGNLRRDNPTLLNCLQVMVSELGVWDDRDVARNLRGGKLTRNINILSPEFRAIQDALEQPRVYRILGTNNGNGYLGRLLDVARLARVYGPQFERIFRGSWYETPTVTDDQEFLALFNVLRRVAPAMPAIVDKESSSSFKASNFNVYFMHPPFCFPGTHDGSRGFRYKQQPPWTFPMFLETIVEPHAWWKFTPRNDCMVVSPSHEIPFIISEVISDVNEGDRRRILVEAIALARVGHFLLKSTSKKRFFVVALYVDANMVISRYIVMQAGDDNAGHKPVSVHQKDFDFREVNEQVDFLRDMYNLTTQITALSGDLDQDKTDSLRFVLATTSKVPSLSAMRHKSKASGDASMDTIAQRTAGPHSPQDEDDLGVFQAEDIQNILHQMNYEIKFIPWEHPRLAVIANKTGDKHRYLKFVKQEMEVKVLQYLTQISSSLNHTISGVRFWPVEGGTVISMPTAGGWLTSLANPDEHLWSVTQQLVEGVAFMHEHNVVHSDLKPQNIVIPVEGGRLSIIDFSLSMFVSDPDDTYSGVVGTEDYIAPEVRKGNYKPILADLWSCGKTLEDLCAHCQPSVERTKVLEIARRLMDRDPEARPKMSTVLEWMASARREEDSVMLPTLQ